MILSATYEHLLEYKYAQRQATDKQLRDAWAHFYQNRRYLDASTIGKIIADRKAERP